ncbi:uncharacterized protein A4U43_C05F30920 [Asparagus officinalis]|uniref:Protein N-terminal asparagine amidohydrolase n=1 Tax=Asparagus officinalis TaxID=4686 RepID=A0A5P1EXI7_ASPOF|nr:protein N-terminal asparagine amidohydrolase isoform X2 [Asparagus officinalis]XP_020265404.1 protein N-terminal asparagine amidohydrolase isoform X2 [Asparagus officinalis]ONK70163.1 uncharacterized protein A4U43_C05F30920 [Asparagus officinalis]
MILVDGVPVTASSSQPQGREILDSLLQSPTLISALDRLKSAPARKVSGSEPVKLVYVFQKEYATVDPSLVQFVGTDEATTCVGLVIRNRETGMTSISHMDFEGIVDMGLSQMLSSIVNQEMDATLDVHLIGGFEDTSYENINGSSGSARHKRQDGFSLPLCSKIVAALQNRKERFHLQTFCVLGHNTKKDSNGNPLPIISGFLVDTLSGLIVPASFDRTSRCPDEVVRRVRVTVAFEDPGWKGKLLETYDTHHDRFQIAPCSWTSDWSQYAFSLLELPDSEILSRCSTSPAAESPDFIENERRMWDYLIKHPDWRQTFIRRKPRIFERTAGGEWKRHS